ncbi:glycosyltransferase [Paenibacillus abyssi]|uniref:Glycosyl transferase family 1 n=1 Tax=Paenibacillus abyssi TaxID=1340531 RepID=A0A917CV10_9BACL|nr:glycosyltransferase family 4 protein [Paenibacillus abyssi]GGF98539.1 hypothetical protein GCM10010916_14730 [Paenibacillus abyssi]
MHVVWAHDHTFYFNESGKFFSGGKLPYAVWERYLGVFGRMTVACRGKKVPSDAELQGKTVSSGPNVDFLVLPSLSNPVNKLTKKGYVDQLLTDTISRADAVIARMPSEIGAEAIRVARKLGKPYAVEMVACAWDGLWNYGNTQGKLYAPLSLWKSKRIVLRSPFTIYVTEQFLQDRYPCINGHTGSCSNVEIPESAVEVLEKRLARIRERAGREPLHLGLIGSLNGKTKGIDTALRALKRVILDFPDTRLYVLGDGSPDGWMTMAHRLGIAGQVSFCGVLPSGKAVFDWLDDIDLYIQPSFQEGLPRATIEAMSRGCPVLGSTAGGIPELIGEECLHRPGSDKHLARQITLAYQNEEWMRKQAGLNFYQSQNYTKAKLDQKRQAFWMAFRDYVRAEGNLPEYVTEGVEAL